MGLRAVVRVGGVAIALLLFPFGLLALLVRGRDTIVIASSEDSIRVHGACPKRLADAIVEDLDYAARAFISP